MAAGVLDHVAGILQIDQTLIVQSARRCANRGPVLIKIGDNNQIAPNPCSCAPMHIATRAVRVWCCPTTLSIRTIASESGEWPRLQARLSGKKRSRRRGSIDLADGRVPTTVVPLPEGQSAPSPRLPYLRALPT